MFALNTIEYVFAWHDFDQKKWQTPNNAYLCNSNLRNLTYELIDPCRELAKAAASWNNIPNSNWTLTFTPGTSPIHVFSERLIQNDYLGKTMPMYHRNGYIVGADVKFNLTHGFTDVSNPSSNTRYYDFESVALHEFGHVQEAGHSILNIDSVMQASISPNTIRNTPEQHDIDVLQDRY